MAPHLIKTYDRVVDTHDVLAHITIPKDLGEAFDANPHMRQQLVPTILKAVVTSLQDPRTSPAVMTANEMKRRCNLAAEGLREFYFDRDFGLSLHRALDMLPEMFMNYLLLEGGHNIAEVGGEMREATNQEQDLEIGPRSDAVWGVDVVEPAPQNTLYNRDDEQDDLFSLPDLNEEINAEDGEPDWAALDAEDDRQHGR